MGARYPWVRGGLEHILEHCEDVKKWSRRCEYVFSELPNQSSVTTP